MVLAWQAMNSQMTRTDFWIRVNILRDSWKNVKKRILEAIQFSAAKKGIFITMVSLV